MGNILPTASAGAAGQVREPFPLTAIQLPPGFAKTPPFEVFVDDAKTRDEQKLEAREQIEKKIGAKVDRVYIMKVGGEYQVRYEL